MPQGLAVTIELEMIDCHPTTHETLRPSPLWGLAKPVPAITIGLAEVWRMHNSTRRILSVDTALGDNLRGAAINDRATAIGVEVAGNYSEKLGEAGAVFSVVTGVEAKNAALAARDVLKPGHAVFRHQHANRAANR